jgi:Protein of unknown function (DUF4245)
MTAAGPTGSRPQQGPQQGTREAAGDPAGGPADGGAAPVSSSAADRASRFTAANMLRSMGPLVLIALLIVGYQAFKSSGETNVHPIDPTSAERLAADQAGYPVVAPTGLPAGYRPTSARTDADPDRTGEPVTLQIGYVTPSDEFAGFVLSDDLKADAVTSVLDGAVQQGTVDLTGTTWTRSTNARHETVLSRRSGTALQLVSGSAPEQELETVAGAVRPFPG